MIRGGPYATKRGMCEDEKVAYEEIVRFTSVYNLFKYNSNLRLWCTCAFIGTSTGKSNRLCER